MPKRIETQFSTTRPADVGKKHYDLYERDREKRRALELWALTLTEVLEKQKRGPKVVPFMTARDH